MKPAMELFLDPSRCIGCRACERACAECDGHAGRPMIHLEEVERGESPQTAPVVCMHCEEPVCAQVCPAQAIERTAEGVVMTALREKCIGCSNCVLACPFGVPRYVPELDMMMKCDLCFDRTSVGKGPMCATVCPSGALHWGSAEEIARLRRERPLREFAFGAERLRTKVALMGPATLDALELDVEALAVPAGEAPPARRVA